MDRRKVLSTSGAAAVAALAGCATGGSASSSGSRTVFSVAQPMLPIAGTSSVEHLQENIAAATLELSDEEVAALDSAAG